MNALWRIANFFFCFFSFKIKLQEFDFPPHGIFQIFEKKYRMIARTIGLAKWYVDYSYFFVFWIWSFTIDVIHRISLRFLNSLCYAEKKLCAIIRHHAKPLFLISEKKGNWIKFIEHFGFLDAICSLSKGR